jgi:hypothetical protein
MQLTEQANVNMTGAVLVDDDLCIRQGICQFAGGARGVQAWLDRD